MTNTNQIMLLKIEIDNFINIRNYYKKTTKIFLYEERINSIIFHINKLIVKLGGEPYYGKNIKK